MCIIVDDLDEAVQLWTEVLGFKVIFRTFTPNGVESGPDVLITPGRTGRGS